METLWQIISKNSKKLQTLSRQQTVASYTLSEQNGMSANLPRPPVNNRNQEFRSGLEINNKHCDSQWLLRENTGLGLGPLQFGCKHGTWGCNVVLLADSSYFTLSRCASGRDCPDSFVLVITRSVFMVAIIDTKCCSDIAKCHHVKYPWRSKMTRVHLSTREFCKKFCTKLIKELYQVVTWRTQHFWSMCKSWVARGRI